MGKIIPLDITIDTDTMKILKLYFGNKLIASKSFLILLRIQEVYKINKTDIKIKIFIEKNLILNHE